ncbi:MAG: Uma2 family endonuclease [Pseudanabaena sp.]|jgi:Uma2 family endonuclease|nr:Uma2 family endonuclease [Pseudanabaena sp. M53BS1SP1A06MG]MCA6584080.1 Uma2 family endonuclease [Pseudanabaena sp. M34BS1SP1A06MG]MCA6586667.1 Uma2 family endonuclease [Pseudanabaena sp. M051S1SP1A06QC]MCA6590201.1 Uma2 family endonuclease [Pseudanabaena sp. M109S1SP1A06QC]MCA6592326.1 Uma2 family endonuclease [Pseudanabaena sp. M38BS1SP1A06MG]MCA6595524.1 Uma2 family endonuclease [Pseudanabaena sp. M046S1SP1A06QC]MCA6602700.1 Uma2 family endonuclease [Pseudanabaena sp. M57BS1SP1A06MG]MC
MQATVTEQEQEPQMHLWSITDYHQMIEVGVLDEDDRVELLEGKIVCMSPQRPFHAASVQRSGRLLFKLLGDRAEIRIQLPVTLGNDSEPEPDIAVVRLDENEYSFRHPEAFDIYLLIEVADWTASKDRNQKTRIYGKNQVLEYWILDLQKRQVYIFRQPEDGSYREELILNSNDIATMQAFPDVAIALEGLFAIAPN